MDQDIIEILNLMKDKNNYTYIIEKLLKKYSKKDIENILTILNNNLIEKSNVLKDHLNSNVNFIINCSKIVNKLKDIQENQSQQINYLADNLKKILDQNLIKEDKFPEDYVSNIKINKFVFNELNTNNFFKIFRKIINYFKGENKEDINFLIENLIKICENYDYKYLKYQLKNRFKIEINNINKYDIIIGVVKNINNIHYDNLLKYLKNNDEFDSYFIENFEIDEEFYKILKNNKNIEISIKLMDKYKSIKFDSFSNKIKEIFLNDLNKIKSKESLFNFKESIMLKISDNLYSENFLNDLNIKNDIEKIDKRDYILFLLIIKDIPRLNISNLLINIEEQEDYLNLIIELIKNDIINKKNCLIIIEKYFKDSEIKKTILNYEIDDNNLYYQELFNKYNYLMKYKIDSDLKLLDSHNYLYLDKIN